MAEGLGPTPANYLRDPRARWVVREEEKTRHDAYYSVCMMR